MSGQAEDAEVYLGLLKDNSATGSGISWEERDRVNRNKGDIQEKLILQNKPLLSAQKNERTCPSPAAAPLLTSRHTSPSHLPEDEAEAVHVGHDVRLKVTPVQTLVQHLRGHVALGANARVGWDVDLVRIAAERQSRAPSGLEKT